MSLKEEALSYHAGARPGKLEVVATKPCITQRDLSLAYTPGVAQPCLEIQKNPEDAFRYTQRGNLVAVVTNGTAVLGLGNIGALAGKPVMEGKGVLFKRFADIDVFDIEVASEDPQEVIRACQLLEPTFGGINLEDIKAPECFEIEETLKKTLKIPVFHDDQHGTAIISGAAMLNALEIAKKRIEEIRVVVSGAGASGIACTKFYISLGVRPENVIMCDSKGVLYKGREEGMNPFKAEFAADTKARTLQEALVDADLFLGLSGPNLLDPEWLKKMARDPIVFAMANPDPEITYPLAVETRKDVIMATGRSDYPNQVNNVLGFPFIFRGALDSRATTINEEMKRAAAMALANLAKQDVPDKVSRAYGDQVFHFGREYLIPKPFDYRVLLWEAVAVARAAMETGVAQKQLDLDAYRDHLETFLGRSRQLMRGIINRAKKQGKRIVYAEGENDRIIRASAMVREEQLARPMLVGRPKLIRAAFERLELEIGDTEIVDIEHDPRYDSYVDEYFRLRQRKGITIDGARTAMKNPNVFAAMMVHMGDADGMVSGIAHRYPDTIRPALQIVKMRDGVRKVSGMEVLVIRNRVFFCADPVVNIDPTAEDLAETARLAAEVAVKFGFKPRVAMLSYSNFGTSSDEQTGKIQRALRILQEKEPDLIADGEMQADTAVVPEIIERHFPFSKLRGQEANVLVFPDLDSANTSYKLLQRLGGAEVVGPILMGMSKPVHLLQPQSEDTDIVNATAIAVVDSMLGPGDPLR
ncbi:MAG: NADP-dependent malic enzyme [Candidatus Eisenbacteria bacterium]|nr:NADP-dependent malic enzyme [Candidatus Latescibacterota bacterium]MBD3301529.1 NADP-dependent malic enzyme [Candidatus Eisenbacteria bacterium]